VYFIGEDNGVFELKRERTDETSLIDVDGVAANMGTFKLLSWVETFFDWLKVLRDSALCAVFVMIFRAYSVAR